MPAGARRTEAEPEQDGGGGELQDPKSSSVQPLEQAPHWRASHRELGTHVGTATESVCQFDQTREAAGSVSSLQRTVTEGDQDVGMPGRVQDATPEEFATAELVATVLAPCVTKKAAVWLPAALPRLHVKVAGPPAVTEAGPEREGVTGMTASEAQLDQVFAEMSSQRN